MKMDSEHRELDKIYKRRDRYDIPDWQRQSELWTKSKKQNLLDSVLRGWSLPKFYFVKTADDPVTYEVVDGQQRLLTLFEFLDNELELSPTTAKEFGGETYDELSDSLQDAVDDYRIDFDEITDATDEDLKEYFVRLQDGLPLTSSERLNSIHSKLRDFARSCARHTFFSAKTSLSDRRYGYFDVMIKVLAIEIDGIDVGTRFDDLRPVVESQASFSARSNLAKRVKAALSYLDQSFAERSRLLRQKSIIQSVVTLACTLSKADSTILCTEKFGAFISEFVEELGKQVELGQNATDPDFLQFQKTVNANVKAGPGIRQRILLRKLLQKHPNALSMMPIEVSEEVHVKEELNKIAHEIRASVHALNKQCEAETGKNLFKPTNDTANALVEIGVPVEGYDGYVNFVSHCYKLFWEGASSRLGQNKPEAFTRLNQLRTELQHDTDHGIGSKIAKKKKSAGSTFSGYSEVKHPSLLEEQHFKFVQMSILADLRNALSTISVSELP